MPVLTGGHLLAGAHDLIDERVRAILGMQQVFDSIGGVAFVAYRAAKHAQAAHQLLLLCFDSLLQLGVRLDGWLSLC